MFIVILLQWKQKSGLVGLKIECFYNMSYEIQFLNWAFYFYAPFSERENFDLLEWCFTFPASSVSYQINIFISQ